MMKKGTLLLAACLIYTMFVPLTADAATSQLSQTINPIQCTYTVLTTGTTTMTPTLCSSQLVPTLSSFTTTLQPRLTGTFASAQTNTLRVYIGQNWFTLGVSSALTSVGDTWTLDLANSSFVLAPSTTYTVIIEAATMNGYLLSSVYQDVLTTQAAPLVPHLTQPLTPKTPEILPAQIDTNAPIDLMAPLGQSGIAHYYYSSLAGTIIPRVDSAKSSGFQLMSYWTITIIAILIGLFIVARVIFIGLLFPAWKRRRKRREQR